MIFYKIDEVKSFIAQLDHLLKSHDIHLKRSHLYETFARALGYKTYNALRSGLPVFMDKSEASTRFHEFSKNQCSSSEIIFPDKVMQRISNKLIEPCYVAEANHHLYIIVDWSIGTVSEPTNIWEGDHCPGGQDETRGQLSSFRINAIVFGDECRSLQKKLQPLVDRIESGYEYATDEYAEFSESVTPEFNEIDQLIEHFDYRVTSHESPTRFDFYGDDYIDPQIIEHEEFTEVYMQGIFLLNANSSDLDLRRLVASEIEMAEYRAIGPQTLYQYFRDLRNTCKLAQNGLVLN